MEERKKPRPPFDKHTEPEADPGEPFRSWRPAEEHTGWSRRACAGRNADHVGFSPLTSRPNFFIPYMDDPNKAEQLWHSVRSFLEKQHGWRQVTGHRIFRLEYEHNGEQWVAQVGEPHRYGHPYTWEYPRNFDDPKAGEWVVAILENEGGPYLVCTHNRGVVRGEPILVGINEPSEVVYFAGFGPDD